MKKLLQIISAFSILINVNAQDQLSNGGFNTWTNNVLAQKPTSWSSSYEQMVPANISPAVVSRSSEATNLQSSVKLTTVDYQGNEAFGFILLGSIGNNGPQGGVPFSISADSIIFDAKFDLQAGDSANVYVVMSAGGNPFDANVFTIGGSSSNWSRMAFKINPFNFTPDTLLLGFTSSDTQNGTPAVGSWIMVDNIRFSNGANYSSPIPNPSFEIWTDISAEDPNNWFTFNDYYAGFGGVVAMKSSDAQEGAYALNLVSDSLVLGGGNELVPGVAIYGFMDVNTGNITGKPFAASPATMTGYYKWSPVNSDQGAITVTFNGGGTVIGQGGFTFDTPTNTYTQFTIPLTLTGSPDSISVVINSGQIGGSSLFIDNLRFSGGDVGVKVIELNEATIGVYPNPTSTDATLKVALPTASLVSYNVINALGQIVESNDLGYMKDGIHSVKLNTQNYTTGVYFVKVKVGENTLTQKVIVK